MWAEYFYLQTCSKIKWQSFSIFFLLLMLNQLPRIRSVHSCIYHSFNRYLSHAYSVKCIIQTLLCDYPKKNLEPCSEYWHYYTKSYTLR